MIDLPTLLATLQAGPGPALLATRLRSLDSPWALGGRWVVPAGAAGAGLRALATEGLPRVLTCPPEALGNAWGPQGPAGALVLLEALEASRLPPWLHFCGQVLGRGRTCVLVTVAAVAGASAHGVGDRYAYDDRNHGLLPMDGALSLALHRACIRVREAGQPAWERVVVAGGSLDLLLEPLTPPAPAALPTLILAAGASRRLGQPKQWVEFEGHSLLRRIVATALAAGGPVTVVVGSRAPEMEAHLGGLPVQILFNPHWEEGMATSLKAGIQSLPASVSGALLLVCDQPLVDAALLDRLRQAHAADPQAILACGYAGTRGTPTLIPARCFPDLLALRGDQGARALLQGAGVVVIPFPGGEQDVDRPEDLPAAP